MIDARSYFTKGHSLTATLKKKSYKKQHKANWIRHVVIFYNKNVYLMCRFSIVFLLCSTSFQLLTDNNRQCHVTQSHALEYKRRMAASRATVFSR